MKPVKIKCPKCKKRFQIECLSAIPPKHDGLAVQLRHDGEDNHSVSWATFERKKP